MIVTTLLGRRGESCLRRTGRPKETGVTSQTQSPEANAAALVLESIEALNAGDTERLLAVVAPDIVIHYADMPEPLHGRETWQQGFELMRRAFPDLEAHVDDLVAAVNKVAIRVNFRGTHQGEFQGIPATGRPIHYISHEFYRLENGLFAEEWICSDMATLFRQLN
jgi:steroid delta-isomerase-like uncharacterized protein